MNEAQKNKLIRFMNDDLMANAVYDVLLQNFMKPRQGDVYIQAASKISLDNLQEAWKVLEGFKSASEVESVSQVNQGL